MFDTEWDFTNTKMITDPVFAKRQVFENGNGQRILVCDKSCETAYIIKWAILIALFGLFFLWLMVGYWHARRRIRNGLQPMAYHRWLAPRIDTPQNNYGYYHRPNNEYGMPNYSGPPPPVYSGDMPPIYQPKPDGKMGRQETGYV